MPNSWTILLWNYIFEIWFYECPQTRISAIWQHSWHIFHLIFSVFHNIARRRYFPWIWFDFFARGSISSRLANVKCILDYRITTTFCVSIILVHRLGVKVRNMKMDFNTEGTWRQVGQWTLMMTIYDFFIWLSRLVTPYNIVWKIFHLRSDFCTILYRVTKRLSQIKKIIDFHH